MSGNVEDREKELSAESEPPPPKGYALARTVAAFWLMGLCNNYTYAIMLSAAHDIIVKVEKKEGIFHNETEIIPYYGEGEGRNCTKMTTGAILLADIVPTLVVKLIGPFVPFFVHFRILLTVVTGIISLVLVAASESILMAIVGVSFASFNSGLGELTMLAYSTNFVLHAIAGWSSGTGGAGLAGSFAYAGMTDAGLSPETALYVSTAVPTFMAIAFWVILKHPRGYTNFCANVPEKAFEPADKPSKRTFSSIRKEFIEKLLYTRKLLPFMIPVGLVYYFEYLINSGLFDKLEFRNTSMSKNSQFRWFNAMYQVGVFVSRSSVTWVHFKKIWIMSLLQGINLIVFFLEAVYGFIPNVWCVFVLIFWEGLLGGAAYVNTFYNMSYMIDKEHRLYALSIASVADTFGIVFSGITAFPVHEFICSLPFKPLFRWP